MATSSSRPQFHSGPLQEALSEVAPQLENVAQNLDSISDDIKNLERYLDAAGVRVAVAVPIGHGEAFGNTLPGQHGDLSTEFKETVESIEWAELPSKDRWRLLYRKARRSGTLQTGVEATSAPWSLSWKEGETITLTPLIETPLAVRLRGSKKLPQLLRAVGEMVTVKRLQIPGTP